MSNLPDSIIWTHSPNGNYTAKSAYAFLRKKNIQPPQVANWSWIWKLKCPKKNQFIVWLILHLHDSILSNSLRKKRKMCVSDMCEM